MRLRFALLAAASSFVLSTGAVHCAEAPSPPVQSTPEAHPWEKDETLLGATIASVRKDGMKAVESHAGDLEAALMNARHSLELAAQDGTTSNDTSKTAKEAAPADKRENIVIPEPNPYPGIGFFLGTYYDQSGKPLDGLRILEVTLDLPGTDSDPHLVDLLIRTRCGLRRAQAMGQCARLL